LRYSWLCKWSVNDVSEHRKNNILETIRNDLSSSTRFSSDKCDFLSADVQFKGDALTVLSPASTEEVRGPQQVQDRAQVVCLTFFMYFESSPFLANRIFPIIETNCSKQSLTVTKD
jgi:hypothetical protein